MRMHAYVLTVGDQTFFLYYLCISHCVCEFFFFMMRIKIWKFGRKLVEKLNFFYSNLSNILFIPKLYMENANILWILYETIVGLEHVIFLYKDSVSSSHVI